MTSATNANTPNSQQTAAIPFKTERARVGELQLVTESFDDDGT
jgi:hypothetical protein